MTLSTARKMAKAKQAAKDVALVALLAVVSVMLMMVFALALDPACGADGNSQRACQEELHRDLAALFTGRR